MGSSTSTSRSAPEVFGFLGPNGAGKSTTMRMLLGLIAPTGGSACILGRDCRADGLEIRRRVGYLPGDFAMYPRLTGAEMLGHLAELRGGTSAAVRKALADRFGAELDRPIGELSTGNRQKIGLISAFMHEPEVLILDEPIAGLDPLVQQSFHALLDETAARGGTILLSSHTLSEVERVADRVAILRVEQLYLWPDDRLRVLLGRYPNVDRVTWVQEEPANMGPWTYIAPRIESLLAETGRAVTRA